MDLSHLLRASETVTAVSDVGAGVERDTLFKRKGLNFTATTSEGRILRSSQVGWLFRNGALLFVNHHDSFMIMIMIPNYSKESERRKVSRHQEQWKSRNLKGKNRA